MHSILEILEESTASKGPDLITLADLKLALGITGTSEDANLQAAITFQSRLIAEYCGRRFGRAEVMETFTFDPWEVLPTRQALILSLFPVPQIHEVSTMGATAQDFQFDPRSGRLWPRDKTWWYWIPPGTPGLESYTVAVNYSGGYDLPEEADARLQRAVIECVNGVRMNSAYGLRDPSIREVQHGDTKVSYVSQQFAAGTLSQHLTPSVSDLISSFKRHYIA